MSRVIEFRGFHHKAGMKSSEELRQLGLTMHFDGSVIYESYALESSWRLMQFTGLHDKKGVKIFDGDVVVPRDISASGAERIFANKLVRWDESKCGFNISKPSECDNGLTFEVIGNIHQNENLIT
jgi:hypothetical protein